MVHHMGHCLRVSPGDDPSAVFTTPWSLLQSWKFLQAITASPGLGILVPTERHELVAADVFGELPHLRGNLVHDAATAILLREHGIKTIHTRDTDFHQFPFLDTVDPIV